MYLQGFCIILKEVLKTVQYVAEYELLDLDNCAIGRRTTVWRNKYYNQDKEGLAAKPLQN
jgi:hypothetical protein